MEHEKSLLNSSVLLQRSSFYLVFIVVYLFIHAVKYFLSSVGQAELLYLSVLGYSAMP